MSTTATPAPELLRHLPMPSPSPPAPPVTIATRPSSDASSAPTAFTPPQTVCAGDGVAGSVVHSDAAPPACFADNMTFQISHHAASEQRCLPSIEVRRIVSSEVLRRGL